MDVKTRIRDFVLHTLNAAPLRDDESFWETRVVDSIGILRLIHFLEAELKIKVPAREVTSKTFASIDAVADYAVKQLAQRSKPC